MCGQCSVSGNRHQRGLSAKLSLFLSALPSTGHSLMASPVPSPHEDLRLLPTTLLLWPPYLMVVFSPLTHGSNFSFAIFLLLRDLWILSRYLGQALFCYFSHFQLFSCESHCPLSINLELLSAAYPASCLLTTVVFHLTHVMLSAPMSWLCNKASVVPCPCSVSSLPLDKSSSCVLNTFLPQPWLFGFYLFISIPNVSVHWAGFPLL